MNTESEVRLHPDSAAIFVTLKKLAFLANRSFSQTYENLMS
jgi:hypothetical protein